MAGISDQLPFSIEQWSRAGGYVRDIARAANLAVAGAAFRAAVKEYPS